jgi:hypothetical protein
MNLTFPFASLNSNIGTRYTSEVLLIPEDNEITNLINISTASVFDLPIQNHYTLPDLLP